MTWILKTRAVTGTLVPLNGEHIEYPDFHDAWATARNWTRWHGEAVYVVNFVSDVVVESTEHLVEACYDRRPPTGGYFEDETGWWMVDDVTDDVTDEGTVWLIGRDGQEREMAVASLPPLSYL
jgi:hypothetical protein